MLVKYLRVRRTSGGVGHRVGLLSLNLGGVAFRALSIAHITVSRGVPFCGPPAGGLHPHCGGQRDATRGRSLGPGLTGHCKDHDRQKADAGSPGLRRRKDGGKWVVAMTLNRISSHSDSSGRRTRPSSYSLVPPLGTAQLLWSYSIKRKEAPVGPAILLSNRLSLGRISIANRMR